MRNRLVPKMNDIDLCLEVVSRLCATTALHSTLNISETIRDRGLVRKDHRIGNDLRGNHMVT